MQPDRRQFLQAAAAGTAALGFASPTLRWRPSEEVRVAMVGLRGRGRNHIEGFLKLEGVKVVALCDVDADILAREVARFTERGEKVVAAKDLRTLLERDDIDAVSIASPNHWHALQTIWSCQAGKHVYVEKPVSHNVIEGRKMVEAARKYGRIVQTGTQSRSSPALAEAFEWIRSGAIGDLQLARGLCYKPRQSIGRVAGPQRVPDSVDYDLWLGPAPWKPLSRKNLHYDWHWDFDTGNGDVGNQGVHEMDVCRWAIGANSLPKAVSAVGGRFGYADDANTPNTLVVLHEYDPAPILFEVRGLPSSSEYHAEGWNDHMDDYEGVRIGAVLHCAGGMLKIGGYRRAVAYDADGKEVKSFDGAEDHFANFIAAVRSGKREDLTADIAEGHLSSALCHIGNASYLAGGGAATNAIEAAWAESPAAEAYARVGAHLRANGVDLAHEAPVLGPRLALDAQHERFTDERANRFLNPRGREPFAIPDEV